MDLLKKTKIYLPNNKSLRDYNKRLIFRKYELKKKVLTALMKDSSLHGPLKSFCSNKLNIIPRNASKTRIRNRCIISGRSRSIYKMFKISRIKFRSLAESGQLLGVSKTSW